MFRSPVIDGIVVVVILLLIVGPKKLPQLGRGLGVGMREFKEGITGDHKDEEEEQKQTLSEAQAMPGSEQPPPAQSAAPNQGSSERSA